MSSVFYATFFFLSLLIPLFFTHLTSFPRSFQHLFRILSCPVDKLNKQHDARILHYTNFFTSTNCTCFCFNNITKHLKNTINWLVFGLYCVMLMYQFTTYSTVAALHHFFFSLNSLSSNGKKEVEGKV